MTCEPAERCRWKIAEIVAPSRGSRPGTVRCICQEMVPSNTGADRSWEQLPSTAKQDSKNMSEHGDLCSKKVAQVNIQDSNKHN